MFSLQVFKGLLSILLCAMFVFLYIRENQGEKPNKPKNPTKPKTQPQTPKICKPRGKNRVVKRSDCHVSGSHFPRKPAAWTLLGLADASP